MKTKIKILFALGTLILNTLACSIFSSGPGKTVELFFRAIENGQLQEAKSYLSNNTIQSLGTDKWDALLTQMHQELINKGGVGKIKITEETITGDIAKVTVSISFGDGTEEASVMDLIKENDKWKLEINASLK